MALTTLVAGCDDPAIEDTQLRPYNCPTWQCGFNSAEVNGRSIRELNLDGQANVDGLRIVGFVAPQGLLGNYSLDTEGDALVARNGQGNTLSGAQLIGAIILVKKDGLLELPVPLTVLGYEEIDSWADGAARVPTYALLYPDVGALLGVRNVCNGDLLDTLATAVTVIGGETYDLAQKTVKPGQTRWLTLACAGSAAAKMRLMNYGPHADFDGEGNPSTAAQRQATLKMITADYCGTGHSYTVNGTPLQWENQDGTVASPGPYGDMEAIWTAAGAVCLDATRLPDADVKCSRPSCSTYTGPAGEWSTYVPD
ncbi:ADYC domain-containing protein [Nannocystis punicea]|uniref:ADYC domain-containing protein n=1 Tax=Nannocystis punicea TaxID=2995304 RepID=A0ABY7H2L4_9BACT|nr:ADYC domain-containing protein [Nannocystis poenicansa]WAS93264.1 ADYC domain-containing protein [Nannocystis poenicansa]